MLGSLPWHSEAESNIVCIEPISTIGTTNTKSRKKSDHHPQPQYKLRQDYWSEKDWTEASEPLLWIRCYERLCSQADRHRERVFWRENYEMEFISIYNGFSVILPYLLPVDTWWADCGSLHELHAWELCTTSFSLVLACAKLSQHPILSRSAHPEENGARDLKQWGLVRAWQPAFRWHPQDPHQFLNGGRHLL